jgi:hypothetical protein
LSVWTSIAAPITILDHALALWNFVFISVSLLFAHIITILYTIIFYVVYASAERFVIHPGT